MIRTVVDGYNLLFRDRDDGTSLQDARQELLRRIDAIRRAGEPYVVVFDGRPGRGMRREHAPGLEVLFARSPESADDLIVQLVREAPRRQTRVVTRDRELAARVRSAGGIVVDPDEGLRPPRRRGAAPPPPPGGKPPPPEGLALDEWERLFRERGEAGDR
ncbi:MAG: NYN domain-containing protein [bacterium]